MKYDVRIREVRQIIVTVEAGSMAEAQYIANRNWGKGEYLSKVAETRFQRATFETLYPEHIALKYYHDYRAGAGKTLKSIQITLAARLEKFNLESLAALTMTDELDLVSIGEKKTALFIIIPDNDSSFNFLVSILYTQLFQQLFYSADHKHGGTLPVPVHFLMDEFPNVSLPDDFEKILSVMRSRGVSVSIILQNIAQLKALFEKNWESVVGNCDSLLYMGGNETSTHKLISESYLGKSTLDLNTYGKSTGRNGNYSTNYQITGRELLTPDEVRMLDNRNALLFIRGERPIMDGKIDIMRHFNVRGTTDGKAEPYLHGTVTQSVATLVCDERTDPAKLPEPTILEGEYELLSEEDLEEIYNKNNEGVKQNEKEQQRGNRKSSLSCINPVSRPHFRWYRGSSLKLFSLFICDKFFTFLGNIPNLRHGDL